ncbi:MAG: hypothetical protein GX639_11600 [Fibrobacter sp.]|nr:hypothetical protein [Fibrobacter sp.]
MIKKGVNIQPDIPSENVVTIDESPMKRQRPIPPEYVSTVDDTPNEHDLLGFTTYVDAFAKIIASRETKLPLSIGLFGNWGSGKSSFMAQLKSKLTDLIKSGNKKLVEKIITVDFNAWHYIDTNIWASLASGIFEGIAKSECDENKSLLESRRLDIQQQLASSQDAKRYLESQRQKCENEIRIRKTGIVLLQLFKIINNKLQGASSDKLNAFVKLTKELISKPKISIIHFILQTIKEKWIYLLVSFASALLLFLLLPYLPIIKNHITIHYLAPSLAFVSSIIPTVTSSIKKIRLHFELNKIDITQLQESTKKVYSILTDLVTKTTKATAEQQEAIKHYTTDIKQLEKEIDETSIALSRLEAGGLIYDHIRSCTANPIYGDNLSLIATIRKDLSSLGEILKDYQTNGNINFRIVVYIDDLDRCPPQNVVEVLQAIHLLLAFPHFVVIAGVDHRWLEGSLTKIYTNSGVDMGAQQDFREFCPQNYLEKIFQVTFNVPPMCDGFKDLVKSIVNVDLAVNLEKLDLDILVSPTVASTEIQSPVLEKTPITNSADVDLPTITPSDIEPISLQPKQQSEEIQKQIEEFIATDTFKEQELVMLLELQPLLTTPRLVKRLVNMYRIIRTAISRNNFELFLEKEYRTVLLLLGISVGFHRVGGLLLDTLQQSQENDFVNNGIKGIAGTLTCSSESSVNDEKFKVEKRNMIRAIELVEKFAKEVTFNEIKKYIAEIQRFSYGGSA